MTRVRITEAVRQLYATLDQVAADKMAQAGIKPTCKVGCADCCMLLTMCTVAEGLLIAEHLFAKPDWRALLPRLREAALANDFEGVNRETYFERRLPCVFLTPDRTCGIYGVRPACCRFHFVVTPPEECSPDHPTGITGVIDLRPLEAHVWNLASEVEQQAMGQPKGLPPTVAPIPLMVLHCMDLFSRDRPGAANRHVKKALEGVPNPVEWLEKHATSILSVGPSFDT